MKHYTLIMIALLLCTAAFAQGPISGPSVVCEGNTITLTNSTPGGTWTSSTSTVATVGASTGIVTGLITGVTTITYTVGASSVTHPVTVNAAPAPITGPSTLCVGNSIMLINTYSGGTWSSSSVSVAPIDPATGVLTGVAAGTTVITYALGTGCSTLKIITVNPVPGIITGPDSVCTGSSITLSSVTSGGIWSSANPSVATVSSAGVLTGVASGTVIITYATTAGCFTIKPTHVFPTPIITGTSSLCVGGSATLSSGPGGGMWSSSSTAVAYFGTLGATTGILIGASVGSTSISMTTSEGCFASTMVSVSSTPAAITGSSSICIGGSITLSSTTGGGTWSSATTSVAYFGSLGGILTGASVGSTSVSYTLSSGCSSTKSVTVTAAPAVYTMTGGSGGTASFCSGGSGVSFGLSGSDAGVSYYLHQAGVGTVIGPIIGTGSTLSFGPVTTPGLYCIMAYPGTTCLTIMNDSVTLSTSPLPTVYTLSFAGGGYCAGGSGSALTLSGSDPGVSYQLYMGSSPLGIPIPGIGSALSFGTMTTAGTYHVVATNSTTACTSTTATATLTVHPLPATYTVTGGGSYCTGGSGVPIGLSGSATGVNYQLYMGGTPVGTPVAGTGAPVSFAGITTAGTYTIVATNATTSCSAAMSGSAVVSISSLPTIATSSTYPCGGAQTITAAGGVTYSWTPTTGLSCSTCGVTDASPATTTTYTVTGTDASGCVNTTTVSVNANRIAGQLTYTGGSSSDVFKVWLIQFNPSDSSITALDSTTTCMLSGGVPYYEFVSPGAGSYLVKAKLNGTVAGTSGYIPTYGLSTPNWYEGASVTHTSARDAMNISMVYGTVPSGPGFISGYVVAGAGKGTAGDIPEPGMLIYLYNTSGSMITYTYTDAAGVYSFTGLAAGTYYIYPEAHKYYTTPSATITLSGSSASAVGIGFRKSTTLGTIKPYDNTQILGVTTNATLSIYPVPTSRILYIEWPVTTTAHTGIVVRDMKGATVYNTEVDPAAADYHSELDLNALPDGIYHITIRSSDIFYTSKLMIAH